MILPRSDPSAEALGYSHTVRERERRCVTANVFCVFILFELS